MKIEIKHVEEATGIFSKTTHYVLELNIQLNEEEMAVLDNKQLRDHQVVELPLPSHLNPEKLRDRNFDLTVSTLVYCSKKGVPHRHWFATVAEAKEYEEIYIESLKNVKAYIEENSDSIAGQSTSFEL